jgi:hypothetical protein
MVIAATLYRASPVSQAFQVVRLMMKLSFSSYILLRTYARAILTDGDFSC